MRQAIARASHRTSPYFDVEDTRNPAVAGKGPNGGR